MELYWRTDYRDARVIIFYVERQAPQDRLKPQVIADATLSKVESTPNPCLVSATVGR
jgi:hypothetical protein